MPETLSCRNGHSWIDDLKAPADGAASSACPVCGAEPAQAGAATVDDMGQTRSYPRQSDDAAPGDSSAALPVVAGHQVLAELGRGGMGVVYLAEQSALKRRVAIKMILPGASWNDRARARFRREAESVAKLSHPNVVPIYEIGEHQGCPYYVMEFLERGSLEKQLAASPLSALEAAALVETLARALHAVHEAGIIHRDLKPANILLARDGTPKVTDFGLAKPLDDDPGLTPTDAVLGTPNYMAPEQAQSGEHARQTVGPAADVYALGAILYRLLTGRPPHRGQTAVETILRVVKDDVVPVRALSPKTPRDVETICLKCLERQPSRRYESALALADDLGRFGRGEPVTARPISRLARALKWVRRRPAAALVLFAGLAVTLATSAVLLIAPTLLNPWPTPEQERDAMFRTAVAHLQTADVQAQLGNREQAQAEFDGTLALLDRLAHEAPQSPRVAKARTYALTKHALFLRQHGELPRAREQFQQALAQLERWAAFEPADAEHPRDRVRLQMNLGIVLAEDTDPAAEQTLRDAAAAAENVFGAAEDCDAEDRAAWASAHVNLAVILAKTARAVDAERHFAKALPLLRRNADEAPATASAREQLAICLLDLGALQSRRQDASALASFQEARATLVKLAEDFPINPRFQQQLASACLNVGIELGKRQDAQTTGPPKELAEAEQNFDQAWKLASALPATPALTELRGNIQFRRGSIYVATNRPALAEKAWTEARTLLGGLPDGQRRLADNQSLLGRTVYFLGLLRLRASEHRSAGEAFEEALAIQRPLVQDSTATPAHRAELVQTLGDYGTFAWQQRNTAAARKCLEEAAEHGRLLAAREATPDQMHIGSVAQYQLASFQFAHNDFMGALRHLDAAIEQLLRTHPTEERGGKFRGSLYQQYIALAQVQLKSQNHAAAFRAHESAAKLTIDHPAKELYLGARFDLQCLAVADKDTSLSPAQKAETGRRYRQHALALLHRALDKGFTDYQALKNSPELGPLRTEPEFAKLLERLNKDKK